MSSVQEPSALGRVVELVRDLRRRCTWDAGQTPETLRPYLVEEVLELDQALGTGDPAGIRTELGDLLLHVAFQIVLAEERGWFGADDLVRAVETKMWRRHPHLFDADGTPRTGPGEAHPHPGWERQKAHEVPAASVLDGLPRTMPALLAAFRLQEKAAGIGFDWPDAAGPRAKVAEELEELDHETAADPPDPERVAEEIGDLLFAVVNLARKLDCDPRAALEGSNRRFGDRFRAVERLARERGIVLHETDLSELDTLWDEVKRGESDPGPP